ncbi:MAG: hypothetical protein IJS74_01370 [Clostridia bacterium]|nr:hypothetical protein [Clostridia bacterium]
MNTFINLLGDAETDIINKTTSTITTVFWYVLGALAAILVFLGVFYGIKLGIRFVKAEDAEARDKAKQQLINAIIGISVAAVIIAVMMVLNGLNLFDKITEGHSFSE